METNKDIKSYTLNEVSELLKLSQRTVYKYIKTGKLKGFKLSSGWRFRESEVIKFITLHEARAINHVK